ncbi:MAG: TlpA disulfide reductase family protein [bacterium]|jgi:peroxiredoxin|nr:TlpA disulfide reductase family protein [bacterium]MDX9798551.1 TlpA disulfide reductase family protein [Bacteroidales bacterium]
MSLETVYGFSLLVLAFIVVINFMISLGLIHKINKPPSLNEPNTLIGQKAPHFEGELDTGVKLDSAKLLGKPYLLVFVSPTCQSCKKLIQSLTKSLDKTPNNKSEIIFINDGSEEEAIKLRQEENINHPILIAPRNNNSIYKNFRVQYTPAFALVNEEGTIEDIGVLDSKKDLILKFLK